MGKAKDGVAVLDTPIPFNRKWHLAKIALRAWSTLFAALTVILCIVVATRSQSIVVDDQDYGYYYSYSYEWAFALWLAALPPAVLVLLWNIAEFTTLCARRKTVNRGIHPGAHVGVDLILWLALVIVWGILSAWISDYSYDYSIDAYVIDDDVDNVKKYGQAIMVFTILLSVIHFFLFVRACVETDQRNRMSRMIMTAYTAANRQSAYAPYYQYPVQPVYYPVPQQPSHKSRHHQQQPQQPQMMMAAPPQGYPVPGQLYPGQMVAPPTAQTAEHRQAYGGYYQPTPTPPKGKNREREQQISGYYAPTSSKSAEASSQQAQAAEQESQGQVNATQ